MKERRVIISPEARLDLFELYEWIARATSRQTAIDYIERIEDFCNGFTVASERGHRRDDIRPGLRITGFEKRITVAFTVDEEAVIILRLFYGGRNWEDLI